MFVKILSYAYLTHRFMTVLNILCIANIGEIDLLEEKL
jgi:hypothetical protein